MQSEWKKVKLSDLIEFNPQENLKKGSIAKKITMDKLLPFYRDIASYELEPFNGGTKFRNGDTLMARITPCLENGKTAKVKILEDEEIGFGSTEYIILRAKNKLDEDFVYYLSRYSSVREPAIKSMVGTSGRQRVQLDVVKNLELLVPPLNERIKIAKILSSLDDKIELNQKINENLELQAQAIFKNWFIDNGDYLDKNKYVSLDNLIDVIDNRGKTPPLINSSTNYPIIDVRALSGNNRIINFNNCSKFVNYETYSNWFRKGHPKPWDILISTVGSIAEMKLFLGNKGCIAQNVVSFRSKNISSLYLYQYLNFIRKDLINYNIGSVQPSIKVSHIIKHLIFLPEKDLLNKFDNITKSLSLMMYNNTLENEKLADLRDTLLPRLMSGELDVSALKYKI